jgi:hypothetical protein
VFAGEPAGATGEFKDELLALPGVYGTHHIGASTDQAQEAIAGETVRIITTYQETGRVPNVVNLATRTPATHMLVVRHRDRPGVLAHVFTHLRQDNLNVQEMENIVFEGAEAAVARINLDGAPSPALCERIKSENQGHTRPAGRAVTEIRAFLRGRTYGDYDDSHAHPQLLAGPAVLPLEVLEQVQENLLSLPGVGMSVLEISHRSKPFDDIIEGCEADIRKLANIPEDYHVLFLQGGASLQFSMVPMNLLPAGASADYIVTGVWAEKAVKEAKRVGSVKIAGSTASDKFTRVPKASELTLDPNAAYVHLTTNNTIYGTEWHEIPDTGNVPLVADTSSNMFSRPLDIKKYGLIYAGAQKNLAPAGSRS